VVRGHVTVVRAAALVGASIGRSDNTDRTVTSTSSPHPTTITMPTPMSTQVAPSGIGQEARALLPTQPGPNAARLVAVVAARAAPPMPPPVPEVSPFMLFCRANWGYFAALQTVALIGAANNGRLAKKRRLEIGVINAKLRAMMQKYEVNSMDEGDEDGPASHALAAGKAALTAGDWLLAARSFAEAKEIVVDAGDVLSRLSASKGLALALTKAGKLRAAIAELESVAAVAVQEGDSSVYGMLGDCHTDLAELSVAGDYYDKCLAMT